MALTALISSTVLIDILGYSSSAHAESSTIDLSATIAPSINVTIPTNLVSLNVNPINSALATSTIPVTVGTNNEYGYSLIMSSSTTDLTRTEALTNNTIPTISTLEDKAGGYTVNDFTINRWGYNINSSNYNSYTSGVELSSTATKTNADTTNVGFAARADYDTPAGIYELDLTFLATAKPPLYTINYTDNSGDASVTGAPINPAQSSTGTAGTGINISTSTPTRDGYTFLSWCSTPTTDEGTVCSGTTYTPGSNYAISGTDELIITLYATWEEDIPAIQNLDSSLCITSEPTTVVDNRDGNKYLVQRLADGNCWLLDNLRLDISNSAVQAKMTSNTTNATDQILGYLKNGGGSSPYTATAVANVSTGFSSYNTPQINTTSSEDTTTSYGAGSGKIGVYYNYCAATAGSYCYANGAGSGNASYDICPAGWRMPTGGSSGEYRALYTAYSSNATNFRNALSTPLSGRYYNSSVDSQGSYGRFWSSTYSSDSYMYYLGVDSSNVYLQDANYRTNGYSVRCVAKDYLQDFSSSDASAMAVGNTKTLTDKRDGQDYMVGKLADGNVWLLDNLRLGSTTLKESLSISNTNMSPEVAFSLPASISEGFDSYTAAQINTASANNIAAGYGSGSKKIGVYYNYCAASAGTYCYASGSGTGNASYDICPSGWMMPYGNTTNKSYYYLYNTGYGGNPTNFRNALSTPLSGLYSSSSASDQGSYGYFWSSTYYDGSNMYLLRVRSSNVYPQYGGTRNLGFSVRCVAK